MSVAGLKKQFYKASQVSFFLKRNYFGDFWKKLNLVQLSREK